MDEEFLVFDPDFELEWECGIDNAIVFTPDRQEPDVTVGQLVSWLLVLAAVYVMCDRMVKLLQSPSCPFCGGKTGHHDGCPADK